jgi:hypothetical protein
MLKKLPHTNQVTENIQSNLDQLNALLANRDIDEFKIAAQKEFRNYTIEFYETIGDILKTIGFENVQVTRDGDTNNRMDAIIVDAQRSIPIEIKSPREVEYINIKSIRQALENKIILLSRAFFPTEQDVTSLAIGFQYPNDRSGVFETLEDFKNTFGFNIGIIDFGDLLGLYYKKVKLGEEIDLETIYYLDGMYDA